MHAIDVRNGDSFLIERGPETYKRIPTAFEPERVWSDCGPHRQERPVVYAISNDYPETIHRFHPEQEVVPL